jgi:hypothetical protein
MAPVLKQLINKSIYAQETRSVILRVIEDSGDQVTKTRDSIIQEMVDDLLESNSAGLPTEEEKELQAYKSVERRLDKDGKKHNTPPMADEEYHLWSQFSGMRFPTSHPHGGMEHLLRPRSC